MFTGIIEAIGDIERLEPFISTNSGMRLKIKAPSLDLNDVALGDSIAINGACMTVVEKDAATTFYVDVSRESLNCTVGLDRPGPVNLEKALCLNARLGGHLVSGHIDGVGEVMQFNAVGESWELIILAPLHLAKYFAHKGSVTINGVSLTINKIDDTVTGPQFSMNLIPHTLAHTTLKHLRVGTKVNLEVDQIARYIERMMSVTNRN